MKQRTISTLLSILIGLTVVGQVNIVGNGGFESSSACPTGGAQWHVCPGWNNVNQNQGIGSWGTPDYFNTCGTGGTMPPATFAGTCSPHSGNAMMAIVVYNTPYPQFREYLSSKLNCDMFPGKTYTVSFWLSNGTGIKSPWTIKNIGVHFSATPLSQTGWGLINAAPQCEITNNIVSTAWSQFTFTFNPTAICKYLTIGAFRPDANNNPTMSFPNPGGAPSVYANYFIDDVEVLAPGNNGPAVSITSNTGYFTVCGGKSLTLTASGSGSYTWSTGSVNSSIVVTPTMNTTYNLITEPGPCGQGTSAVTATITVVPDPKLNLDEVIQVCKGKSVPVQGNGTSVLLINGPSTSIVTAISPSVSAIYTFQVNNEGAGYSCSKTIITQVQVNPNPETDFSYSVNPCGGGVYFTDLSRSDITGRDWVLSDVKTSTLQNPYHFYTNGGSQTVALTSTNRYGCSSAIERTISIPQPPLLTVSTPTQICRGMNTQLVASGGISYQWSPDPGPGKTDMPNPTVNPYVSTDYSVTITTPDTDEGQPCEFLLTTSVRVDALSSSGISANAIPESVIVGEASTLVYSGNEGAIVVWAPPTVPPAGYTVQISPARSMDYTVTATLGVCTETTRVHVDVVKAGCDAKDIFIPSTFTPNGDGLNDVLFVRGSIVKELYFTVYNRWGEMVFETTDKNIGWDGNYKGKSMDAGVFGWYLKAKCNNGDEITTKGNVTLLR